MKGKMEYEPQPGCHLLRACEEAVALANKSNEPVRFKFNDDDMLAVPGDNAKTMYDQQKAIWKKQQDEYESSPEGIASKAAQEKSHREQCEAVATLLNTTRFKWTDDMREISGFGGGYEATCRAMVSAGVQWLHDHPEAKPKFHTYSNITGIISEDNDDAKALSEAVMAASAGDCTGAMHQYSISHALQAHKMGWDDYCKMMRENRIAA